METHPPASAAGTVRIGNDLSVTRLGFGAMRITGKEIWGSPPDKEQAITTLRRAVDLGVTFIDTADSYGPGVSETLIAEALYPYPDDIVIATKGGLVRPGPDRWERDGRPEHLRDACEASLTRLKLDCIPLYQLHKPDPKIPFADSVGALDELRMEGKIRHIGLSTVTADQLREAQQITSVASVQNRYNTADRSSQAVLDSCTAQGITFIPWAPVKHARASAAVLSAAARHGVTPHQVALAWLLAVSPVTLPIPGTGSPVHVADNIAAATLMLDASEIAAITSVAAT